MTLKHSVKLKRNGLRKRISVEVARDYWVRFSTDASLTPDYEQEPLTRVSGEIIFQPNRDEDEEKVVGALYGWVVRSNRIWNDGYSFYEACDAESGELEEIAAAIWDDKQTLGGGYREDLVECGFHGDLIVASRVTVQPEHRGKGIGLLALWRFLDYFGTGAKIAVLKPFPLNHTGRRDHGDEDTARLYAQFEKTTLEQGKTKLVAYWGQLGFERVPDTDLYYLDMEYQRPSLEDLLKDDRKGGIK